MGSKLLALSEHGQYEIRYMNCVTWISSPSSGEPSGQTRGLGEYDVYCIVVGHKTKRAQKQRTRAVTRCENHSLSQILSSCENAAYIEGELGYLPWRRGKLPLEREVFLLLGEMIS